MVWKEKKTKVVQGKKVAIKHRRAYFKGLKRKKNKKIKIHKVNPSKTIENYKNAIGNTRLKKQVDITKWKEEREKRLNQLNVYEPLPSKNTSFEKIKRKEITQKAVKQSVINLDNNQQVKSLKKLGYKKVGQCHKNQRPAFRKSGYRRGLETQYVHLGGLQYMSYQRPYKKEVKK